MNELPDDADPLVTRLRSTGPTGGLGVDFEAVVAEVGRRRRRAQSLRTGLAAVVLVAAVGVGARVGNLGVGSQGSSSAAAGMPATMQSAPEAARGVEPGTADAGSAVAADGPRYAAGRSAGGCPTSISSPVADPLLDWAGLASGAIPLPLPDGPPVQVASALPQMYDQLVPASGAVSAVVCRYDSVAPAVAVDSGPAGASGAANGAPRSAPVTLALSRERSVTTQAGELAAGLAALRPRVEPPPACPVPAGAVASWLLVRMTYDAGAVWVVVIDDGCRQLAGNGVVRTSAPIAAALRALVDTGTWRS